MKVELVTAPGTSVWRCTGFCTQPTEPGVYRLVAGARQRDLVITGREKRLEIALTYVFGIGRSTSLKVCADLGLNPDTRVRDLTDDEVNRIRVYVDQNLRVEGDLRRDVAQDIKRKIEIGSYQGVRHRKGLPVRGQRTHTNARTRKGPKKTVANKKKAVMK